MHASHSDDSQESHEADGIAEAGSSQKNPRMTATFGLHHGGSPAHLNLFLFMLLVLCVRFGRLEADARGEVSSDVCSLLPGCFSGWREVCVAFCGPLIRLYI